MLDAQRGQGVSTSGILGKRKPLLGVWWIEGCDKRGRECLFVLEEDACCLNLVTLHFFQLRERKKKKKKIDLAVPALRHLGSHSNHQYIVYDLMLTYADEFNSSNHSW
jgi:hypothetical protein